MRGARRRAALLVAATATALSACARPWDVGALEARHPELASLRGHRLGDARPYLLPAGETLTLFLCRWPTGAPIPLSLPANATPEELAALELAARAWEAAGLGVRFERGGLEAGRGIEIRLLEAPEPGAGIVRHAATTVADCAVEVAALGGSLGPTLPARLVFASIHLGRGELDVLGRPVAHSAAELAGSALHELGHALGFQGHARRGDTVMVRETEAVRRAGRRLLAGDPLRDATLQALYALPPGVVVKRLRVSREQTALVERLARIAARRGLVGPQLRVGDRAARLAWWDGRGRPYALLIFDLDRVLRRPAELRIHAAPPAAELLAAP